MRKPTETIPFEVSLSELDYKRFGVVTAKATHVHAQDIDRLLAFCQTTKTQLCIARCDTNDLKAVHALENHGFRIMDTLVYFSMPFRKKWDQPIRETHEISPIRSSDIEKVRALGLDCFKGYIGHYHSDERLPTNVCDELYADWVYRDALERGPSSEVFVARVGDEPVAFATLRMNNAEEGEGVLFAVARHAQGQGLYQSLMIRGALWCREQGARHMVVSTQINNVMVQRVWATLGFQLRSSTYTLHGWF